jgi:hypothetical protein
MDVTGQHVRIAGKDTDTSLPESALGVAKSSHAQDTSVRYWRARMQLHHSRKKIQERLYRWKYIARSLFGHMENLLARRTLQLDFGPAMRSLPNGSLVPDEKTIARSRHIQNLQATYSGWVGVLEAEIFLMGFEAGVRWSHRTDMQR